MAKLIKTDGSVTEVKPRNGKHFTLGEMRKLIGCDMIEYAFPSYTGGNVLVVDEEGKFNGKELNEEATRIYGRFPFDFIVGDALYCSMKEIE